jgi:DNA gyrase subunit A
MERDKIKADYDDVLATHHATSWTSSPVSIPRAPDHQGRAEGHQAKHATPRSRASKPAEGEIETIDLIPNDPNIVTMTHLGSIKRTLTNEYRVQAAVARASKAWKPAKRRRGRQERLRRAPLQRPHARLPALLHEHRPHVCGACAIRSLKPHAPAKAAASRTCAEPAPEEKIAAVLIWKPKGRKTRLCGPGQVCLFATKDGTVKKTALEEFKNYRKDGIIAIKLDEGNDLVDVVLTDGNKEICLVTHEGMCARFHETGDDPESPNLRPSAATPHRCAWHHAGRRRFL